MAKLKVQFRWEGSGERRGGFRGEEGRVQGRGGEGSGGEEGRVQGEGRGRSRGEEGTVQGRGGDGSGERRGRSRGGEGRSSPWWGFSKALFDRGGSSGQ